MILLGPPTPFEAYYFKVDNEQNGFNGGTVTDIAIVTNINHEHKTSI